MAKYSQYDEEYIIDEIIQSIGMTNKFFVEIGCHANGELSNTYFLKENGWVGHWFDMEAHPAVIQKFITAENINEILTSYDVPFTADVFSLDIDGNDYWVWKAMTFRPRVILIEYNKKRKKGVQKYDPEYEWHYQKDFGCSETEMKKLGEEKGYNFYKKTEGSLIFIDKTCQK